MIDWGELPATIKLEAHKTRHQDGGADEILVTGLSGLLADDQHVLDAEVTAVAVALTTLHTNTILKADADHTPIQLAVVEQTLIGRLTSGVVASLTGIQVMSILASKIVCNGDEVVCNNNEVVYN